MTNRPEFMPWIGYREYPVDEMIVRAAAIHAELRRRRTVRDFSDRPVPREVIEQCILAAGTAPSGANLQPWQFVVISNPKTKRQIRVAAEKEEREFYTRRAPQEWLDVLEPLGTGPEKPYLDRAPYLIAIFAQSYGIRPDGTRIKHYYAVESVGIATGMLLSALHHSGLAALTHTPSPMGFLNEILARPTNERPFLLLVVGYPAKGVKVPVLRKKSLEEIASFVE